jgi:single-stranded DNA-binding protein
MINVFYLSGFVAGMSDKEMGKSGARSLSVTIAAKERWMDKKTQEWKEETHFHRISFTGKIRDRALATGLSVGEMVMVSGKLSTFPVKDEFSKQTYLAGELEYMGLRKYDKDLLERTNQDLINGGQIVKHYGPRAGNKDESNTRHIGEDIPF